MMCSGEYSLADHVYSLVSGGLEMKHNPTQSSKSHPSDDQVRETGLEENEERADESDGVVPTGSNDSDDALEYWQPDGIANPKNEKDNNAVHDENVIIDGYYSLGDNMFLCENEDNMVYFPCM